MNEFIKRLLAFVTSAFCAFGGVGCDFDLDSRPKLEYLGLDGFSYTRYVRTNTYHLTNDRRRVNSEILHISPYYKGIEVQFFGNTERGPGMMTTEMHSFAPSLANVKTLSMPYCMQRYEMLEDTPMIEAPQKIILVRNSNGDEGFVTLHAEYYEEESYLREIYCSSLSYRGRVDALLGERKIQYPSGESYSTAANYRFKICKANTAYMFNYGDCPNDGYFFIDDFEYGEMIENTPYTPLRSGYMFDGWYKEPACINAWNFEMDTLPQAQYNEEEQEIYQETKLYAKWIKN